MYNIHYGNNETMVTVAYCNDHDDTLGLLFTIYQLVIAFAMPGMIIVVCYSVVIKELWKSTKNVAKMTTTSVAVR